jgi:hypothetical protein
MSRVVIHGIYTSPGHNYFGHHEREPDAQGIEAHESVELVAGKGIPGDRFFGWKEDYKGQVTFIDRQTVDVVREFAGDAEIEPSAFRRNVVISGVDLNALVGKTFRLGGVLLEGTQKCAPCYWMDAACGKKGTEKVMFNRGGLRCRILESGRVSLGEMELEGVAAVAG